jgi:capsule polysaccharide export protein KpsE/RkpR
MRCIVCYVNPILITNAKKARKDLILYNNANGIIALKKHVYVDHCMIAKIFEKVNNLLNKLYER